MKVLFWLSIGLDRRSPSEHLLTDMVEALYTQGNTVCVLQKNTGGPKDILPKRMLELGVETMRIASTPAQKDNLAGRFAADVKYALQCREWLREHQEFDRIFMQSSNVAGIQTRILCHVQKSVPVIFNVQDIFPENAVYSGKMKAGGAMYKWFAAMQRHAYRYASRIITISEDMKDQLIEIGTNEKKIQVVYNWSYRDSVYSSDELDFSCVESIFDQSKFNVVYAGNIGLMQNVELVIRAAAQMIKERDICFHVIGNGMYRKKLEQLAKDLHADNLFFHDMMGEECASAIYSAADVNVIPLAKNIYRTALPSKTATCLACGKPIVFALGNASKFARKMAAKTGSTVVECCDYVGLCEAIRRVKEGNTRCDASKTFASEFSRTANSAVYASIINGTE